MAAPNPNRSTAESILTSDSWTVQRHGHVKEVVLENNAIRYHVQIWDEDRKPFISQWFNDPAPAADFLEKVKSGFDPRYR